MVNAYFPVLIARLQGFSVLRRLHLVKRFQNQYVSRSEKTI